MKYKHQKIKSTAIFTMVFIVAIWALAYPLASNLPSTVFKEPLNSLYGVLNVLFTALAFSGVIITLVYQNYQAEAAHQESMEKSILEMFQVFTSSDFQKTKDAAFRVLIPAIQHKKYATFVASRLYAVEQLKFPDSQQITQTIEALEGNKERLKSMDFSKIERDDRLKLDDVLNFFAMLAQRESAIEVVKHVDFAYDWWRPSLLVIAQSQLDHFDAHPKIQQYCKNKPIMNTLAKLDILFGHAPLKNRADILHYLQQHPKMQDFNIDPAFFASDKPALPPSL